MGSTQQKPHVVLVPFPAHGHVAPHTQLARILLASGVHVTLVHTELHHRRLLRAKGRVEASSPPPGFGVEVISDGLSLEDPPRTLLAHHEAMEKNCLEPFKALLRKMKKGVPPVSCVVADTPMPFAAVAAREVGVSDVQFFTASACGLMGYLQFEELMKRKVIPLKGGSDYKSDGSLDTPLDWMPGMKGMRLRDMPTFCHTTDANEWLVHFHVHQMKIAAASKALILNTFYEMEKDVLDALAAHLPEPIYTVGPIASIVAALPGDQLAATSSDASLLQEDRECMAWLDGKATRSVVYVSFGSHANMGDTTLSEFAVGLARCGSPYLWVLRHDMAADVEVGEDGLVVPWCAQEAVLGHPAVGLFFSHCGWNSILESVAAGVPVLGCPVVSEQTTNCRQVSVSWGIGDELPQGSGSDEIAALVREMMAGKKGKEAREKVLEWKRLAQEATKPGGSSHENIGRLVDDVLLKGR
ncbi:hypothetical protein QOZ80_7BG0595700 [Eleusine coracana subsp. coracana]|nr:hypothetical protein QOZ80_7BG0595700 [Eleusine coracana subsp. coracana]